MKLYTVEFNHDFFINLCNLANAIYMESNTGDEIYCILKKVDEDDNYYLTMYCDDIDDYINIPFYKSNDEDTVVLNKKAFDDEWKRYQSMDGEYEEDLKALKDFNTTGDIYDECFLVDLSKLFKVPDMSEIEIESGRKEIFSKMDCDILYEIDGIVRNGDMISDNDEYASFWENLFIFLFDLVDAYHNDGMDGHVFKTIAIPFNEENEKAIITLNNNEKYISYLSKAIGYPIVSAKEVRNKFFHKTNKIVPFK